MSGRRILVVDDKRDMANGIAMVLGALEADVLVAYSGEEALEKLPAESPVREHLEVILRNAHACRRIIGDLLALARPAAPRLEPTDLGAVCREVARTLVRLAEKKGVSLVATDSAAVPVEANPDELRQAVLNLALNAIEATASGKEVRMEARREDGAAVLEVRDQGAGIPEADRERIFQPFFTTKTSGTGLGLPVAQGIIERHGGRIDLQSAVGEGAVFRVVLP